MTAHQIIIWLLGIFSGCIIGFMGWVGLSINKLNESVVRLSITHAFELVSMKEDIKENTVSIQKILDYHLALELTAKKEEELALQGE